MFKKITVLAMALGVVAVLALPASASATWRHATQGAIQQNVQFELTGTNFRYQGEVGGIECQITAKVTLETGTTGKMETFAPHPTSSTVNCKALGGLAFCQIHELNPTGLPWTLHTVTEGAENKIQVTTGDLHTQMTGSFCPYQQFTLTAGTLTLTPEQEPVQTLQLKGALQVHMNGATEQLNFAGQFHVLGAANGTYRL